MSYMDSVNVTTARKNLYHLIAEVNDSSMPVMITNARGKNAVILSEDDWNSLQETVYLNSIPGFADSIREADEEGVENAANYNPEEEW